MRFVALVTAPAQAAPTPFAGYKRLALILAWIAAALFAGFAVPSVAAAAPVVTGVSPNDGRAECCSEIIVSGSGFLDATEVDFGPGNPAENFTVLSDNEIDVVTASGPIGTTVDITVTSPEGTTGR